MTQIKILKGNKKNCIKEILEKDAARLAASGEVEILDDSCDGYTAEGLPCKLSPKEGENFCWRHQED